jgi:hypothetical protein
MTPTSETTYLNKAIENCNKCGGWLYRFELTRQYYFYHCEKCDAEFYWNKDDDLWDKELFGH